MSPSGAELLARAEWIHVDQAGWHAVHPWWSAAFPAPATLGRHGQSDCPGFSPAGVDLYVPTISALRRTYGELPPSDLLELALVDGARTVVATDGPHGSVHARGAPGIHPGSTMRGSVRSTLGAGDVFHGALLAGVAGGMPVDQAMAYATVVAFVSCAGLDGRSAIPDHPTALATLDAVGALPTSHRVRTR